MCGCECCIYAKRIHASLISWRDWYLKNSNIKSKMLKTEGPVKCFCMYETYKNAVMPHGHHIYAKSSDMANATMCAYPQSYNSLPHRKGVLKLCANYTCINLPEQEIYNQYSDTTPSIQFHIYHIIGCCTSRRRIPLKDKKICRKCKHESSTDKSTKIYTRKELVMTETTIYNFHNNFHTESRTGLDAA